MPDIDDIDKENMISVLDNFWKQVEDALKLGISVRVERPVDGIVLCGMGGSSFPGEIVKEYIQVNVPVEVVRNYKVPSWAGGKTLVFVVSYSGNTEEALSCLKSAKGKGAKIVCISSDGKLKEKCRNTSTPFIEVPKGIQPRAATGYQTMPILNVLINSRIISEKKREEMQEIAKVLRKDVKESAEGVAQRLVDKIPLIYTSERMSAVARLWKAAINENAKAQAFFNVFPEMNHNDMNGFINQKAEFYAVFIEDIDDHERIKKRMRITKELLQEKECPVLMLRLTGPNFLARIFSAILMGMYVGYYLAIAYGTDPTPVEMVEGLKKKLGSYIS